MKDVIANSELTGGALGNGTASKALYYYKDEKMRNIPILRGEGDIYLSITNKEILKKIQTNFPKSENNLFVLVDGHEFYLGS